MNVFFVFRVVGRTLYVRFGFGIGFIRCASFGCRFEMRMELFYRFHRLDIVAL